MSHYFNNGHRTPALDAAYLSPNRRNDLPLTPKKSKARPFGEDEIRRMAENELGAPIPDDKWTYQLREAWKIWFHARLYGAKMEHP